MVKAADITSASLCVLCCAIRCVRHSPAPTAHSLKGGQMCKAPGQTERSPGRRAQRSCRRARKAARRKWRPRRSWKQESTRQQGRRPRKAGAGSGRWKPETWVLEKWTGSLYKPLRQRSYSLADSLLSSRAESPPLVFRPGSSAHDHDPVPIRAVPKDFDDGIRPRFLPCLYPVQPLTRFVSC